MFERIPKVSIITPIYNSSLYLDYAVKSVIEQTFDDWELLLVDDGSTDNSLQIAVNWSKKDSRIKMFYHADHANKGVSATRNLGIDNARGKYIALLDSDDEWLPSKLAIQVSILEEDHDIGIIYCKAFLIGADGTNLTRDNNVYGLPEICARGKPGKSEDILRALLTSEVWMPCSTVVIKGSEVRNVGGFDESLTYQTEDRLLFTLVSVNNPIFFLDQVLVKYRMHGESFTGSIKWRRAFPEYFNRLYQRFPSELYPLISEGYLKEGTAYIRSKYYKRDFEEVGFINKMFIESLRNDKIPIKLKVIFVGRILKLFGMFMVKKLVLAFRQHLMEK